MNATNKSPDNILERRAMAPLDEAVALICSGIDHIEIAKKTAKEMEPMMSVQARKLCSVITSVLDTALDKQWRAAHCVREHQRLPGGN